MKPVLAIIISFLQITATAQSPYLSFILKMPARQSEAGGDSVKSTGISYKIEMKICEPKKKTEIGNWQSHEVSTIQFDSLKAKDITCGKYFEEGMPTIISGQEKKKAFNQFEYANQLFAWEHIFIFRISNISSRGVIPEMYVVMPMKYKSFVTHINLTGLEFQPGKVLYLSDLNSSQKGSNLEIDQSLKDHKTIEVKKFFLEKILEDN